MSTPYTRLGEFMELARRSKGTPRAISFGDSWFQYPLRNYGDLEVKISRHFGKDLLILDDSFPGRDAKDSIALVRRWAGIARDLAEMKKPLNVILTSMGGNDVIGQDFYTHLKSPEDPVEGQSWPWNATIPAVAKSYVKLDPLRETFRKVQLFYESVISMRDSYAPGATIVTHTYGDVTPMNKAYKFWGFRSGPWLWKPMNDVGLTDASEQRALSRWLLESFFNMLTFMKKSTTGMVVLDTRGQLSNKSEWDNEIHPLGPGFQLLVDNFWVPAVEQAIAPALLRRQRKQLNRDPGDAFPELAAAANRAVAARRRPRRAARKRAPVRREQK